MITNKYEHIKRFREIAFIFARYGFGQILDALGILKYLDLSRKDIKRHEPQKRNRLSLGERLRLCLEELGTTFIKLGQLLSTRPDLLPQPIIKELVKLQDTVPAFSFEEAKKIIEEELEGSIDNFFSYFNKKALAAASISQVHRATLHSGEDVVVKVRRPDIEKTIRLDLKIMHDIAWILDNHTKLGKLYEFDIMVNEFERSILNELDFINEGKNIDIISNNLRYDPVFVPKIYWEYTEVRILTMEYIEGISLKDISDIPKEDRSKIATKLTDSIICQILRDGFFHADPHPGNIILNQDKVYFIDFGMVGKVSENRKKLYTKFLLGLVNKNSKLIVESVVGLEAMTKYSNIKNFKRDINQFFNKYLEVPIAEINLKQIFTEIFRIAYKYDVKLPNEFFLLAKSIVTLEGTIQKLDPTLSIITIAEPAVKKIIFKIYSPMDTINALKEGLEDYSKLFVSLPGLLIDFFRKLEDEDFIFHIDFKSIDKAIKRFDSVSNRITLSIMLLSLSVVSAGMIVGLGLMSNSSKDTGIFEVLLKGGVFAGIGLIILLVINTIRSDKD